MKLTVPLVCKEGKACFLHGAPVALAYSRRALRQAGDHRLGQPFRGPALERA